MRNDVVFKGSWNELPFSGRLSRNCYQDDPQSFRQLANTSRKLTSTTTTLTSVVTVEAGRATRTTRMMKKEVTQEDLVYNALISRFQPKENKSILSLSLFPLLYIIKFSTPLGLSYVETTSSNLEKKIPIVVMKTLFVQCSRIQQTKWGVQLQGSPSHRQGELYCLSRYIVKEQSRFTVFCFICTLGILELVYPLFRPTPSGKHKHENKRCHFKLSTFPCWLVCVKLGKCTFCDISPVLEDCVWYGDDCLMALKFNDNNLYNQPKSDGINITIFKCLAPM